MGERVKVAVCCMRLLPAEHPGYIFGHFALAKLDCVRTQIHSMTSELEEALAREEFQSATFNVISAPIVDTTLAPSQKIFSFGWRAW